LIKIIHIITRLDMGGSAQNTLQTCQQLSCKYQILLAYGLSKESKMTGSEKGAVEIGLEKLRETGGRTIAVPPLVRRIRPVKDLQALCALVRIMRRESPDIVHTHTSKAGILGRLAAGIVRAPHIVHTPHGHVFYGHFGRTLSWIFLRLEKLFARFTDRLVSLSEGESKDYAELSVYPADKIVKIHSGVDVRRFESGSVNIIDKQRSLGIGPIGCCIGFVGWLLPIKGPMHLLRAMKYVWQDFGDAHLVFVGKGDLDIDLRAEALKINQNGTVKFLGWRNDIDEIMQIFDIFTLPSLNEGMGRVLVEAMAAGKPIVASNVGGIPDLVKPGENGLLVPPGDEKALADSIKRLIKNPEEAKLMGRNGRRRCRQFSLTSMVAKIDGLYADLVVPVDRLPAECSALDPLHADIAGQQKRGRNRNPVMDYNADLEG
jgi:glycosyltransferase involved in cell wall biosynthesis